MGLFSAGFPTGVEGHLPHLTQRTGFYSLSGWATQSNQAAPEAPLLLNNFLRVSSFALICKPVSNLSSEPGKSRLLQLLANLSLTCFRSL